LDYSRCSLAVNLNQLEPYKIRLIEVMIATARSTIKLVILREKIISINTDTRYAIWEKVVILPNKLGAGVAVS
jgi:hypothetical protein